MDSLIEDLALRCVRCGFCLDACPTFRLTGNEADSPRGRVYLMRSVVEGEAPLDRGVLSHLDACLGCRACEPACPSGVHYGEILERFRGSAEVNGMRSAATAFARRQLLSTITTPHLFVTALRASRLLQRLTGGRTSMPAAISSALTGNSSPVTLPVAPGHVSVGALPARSEPVGSQRYTVGILEGCAMRVLYPHVNRATVRLLQRAGCAVVAPPDAGCCGALHAHAGFVDEARSKARALIDAFESTRIDALVVNSAGCGSMLKEYGRLLADDPAYAERAASLAARVRDVCEFLHEVGLPEPRAVPARSVAYHDACHLAHGQGITAAPRALLRAVPGLTLVDLEEADTCCGSAGTYNLTQPDMARRLLDRKVDAIARSGASAIAAGNPGCLAWIEQGLRERGLAVAALHPVEILDEAHAG